MEGSVKNNESFRKDEIEVGAADRYGLIFGKPFSLRLCVLNFYKSLLPEDMDDPPIPPHIPFKQDTCVICITNKPDILYSGCGHMCMCSSCDRAHPVNTCPLCKSEYVNKFYLRHY